MLKNTLLSRIPNHPMAHNKIEEIKEPLLSASEESSAQDHTIFFPPENSLVTKIEDKTNEIKEKIEKLTPNSKLTALNTESNQLKKRAFYWACLSSGVAILSFAERLAGSGQLGEGPIQNGLAFFANYREVPSGKIEGAGMLYDLLINSGSGFFLNAQDAFTIYGLFQVTINLLNVNKLSKEKKDIPLLEDNPSEEIQMLKTKLKMLSAMKSELECTSKNTDHYKNYLLEINTEVAKNIYPSISIGNETKSNQKALIFDDHDMTLLFDKYICKLTSTFDFTYPNPKLSPDENLKLDLRDFLTEEYKHANIDSTNAV
jgi:hypothetical protein